MFYKDPVYTLIDGDTVLELPRSAKKMQKVLGTFSPRDKAALAVLRFHIWCFTFFHTPILDLGGLKVRHPRRFSLPEFLKMGPAVLLTPYLMSISAGRYIRRFRNPHVRRLLETVVDPKINALSLIYTLSTFDDGDGGYPEGGSLRMSRNMADTFTTLGGQIRYRTPATGVRETPEGICVLTENGSIASDAVVISSDARTAIDKLFPEPLETRWARRLRSKLRTAQCMFVAIGVRADLSGFPRCMQIVLERYCDTFEGSYMSEWMPWHFNANAPIRFRPGIFFTGQRTAFSGGLPVAAETGRRTAQILCKSFGMVF